MNFILVLNTVNTIIKGKIIKFITIKLTYSKTKIH
jgi:hypothetical protein